MSLDRETDREITTTKRGKRIATSIVTSKVDFCACSAPASCAIIAVIRKGMRRPQGVSGSRELEAGREAAIMAALKPMRATGSPLFPEH